MEFLNQHKDAVIVSVLSILFVACFEMTLVFLSSHYQIMTP